jgi:hypothetical protein
MEGTMKSTRKPTTRTKVTGTVSRAAEPVAPRLAMPAKEDIAGRAYELYANSCHQPGRDVEFWLEAERQLQRGHEK